MKKQKKQFKAFTLIELIIIITILSILSVLAFISFQNYTQHSRDGNRVATLKQIEKGLTLYNVKTSDYPEPDEYLEILS
jgi:prepilin-type N-terminal cleavage/methylation domain-containing protein